MDPQSAIDDLASGSIAKVLSTGLVALFLVCVVLFRRLNQVQDQRIEDMREYGDRLHKMQEQANLALGALVEPVREAVREMRGRR
ncbi:hypothetical protein PANO111632_02560 [Paracoccus nototheniae]|uniref:Uncharacterized protein n=1 Tax=Paracoccus nototheniae TaxID=2489002 RepID=A0ABW4DZC5_9RHOB|nr:hypothetical protein [Paracoccus nototheniae]